MNFTETALTFDCDGETLVGVVSLPETPGATAVVIVVGGPQYRAGSHRQFVHLARSLAANGHAVLRFDYRGMGDSSGPARDFEDVTPDIGAAITALQAQVGADVHAERQAHANPQAHAQTSAQANSQAQPHAGAGAQGGVAQRIVLLGLCDGASAALLYCDRAKDARVAGLVLLNPWVRSAATLARTHVKHYYARRFMERAFWFKLLRGGVEIGSVLKTLKLASASTSAKAPADNASFQQKMLRGWQGTDREVLLLLSGDDYTAREFIDTTAADPAWSAALQGRGVTRHDLAEADHTFSNAAARHDVERLTVAWLSASQP